MDRFRPGYVYAVGTILGSYLLALGVAEPVADDVAALVLPPEQQMFGPIAKGHSYTAVDPATRPPGAKKKTT